MLHNYFPILLFLAIGVVFGTMPIMLGYLLGPRRPDQEKLSTYECGFAPTDDARLPFHVRYYLIAILFILFDLEIAFIVPWAVVFRHIGSSGIIAMAIFILLLLLGFVVEWKKGALEWE
ncbi:MAG: NAD(P)H-quinone oxidoreductase subunit 3 [Gammaproteobacteria bacterium]|nr:NAD(P)H-quinone oxidoreductase subunit 3 [Gammaproteobacteria bacterium]MCP4475721.1 NAD(P)H-quinone oxidoreductase subunit 3 [Gammaproteobacteria bacterium]